MNLSLIENLMIPYKEACLLKKCLFNFILMTALYTQVNFVRNISASQQTNRGPDGKLAKVYNCPVIYNFFELTL